MKPPRRTLWMLLFFLGYLAGVVQCHSPPWHRPARTSTLSQRKELLLKESPIATGTGGDADSSATDIREGEDDTAANILANEGKQTPAVSRDIKEKKQAAVAAAVDAEGEEEAVEEDGGFAPTDASVEAASAMLDMVEKAADRTASIVDATNAAKQVYLEWQEVVKEASKKQEVADSAQLALTNAVKEAKSLNDQSKEARKAARGAKATYNEATKKAEIARKTSDNANSTATKAAQTLSQARRRLESAHQTLIERQADLKQAKKAVVAAKAGMQREAGEVSEAVGTNVDDTVADIADDDASAEEATITDTVVDASAEEAAAADTDIVEEEGEEEEVHPAEAKSPTLEDDAQRADDASLDATSQIEGSFARQHVKSKPRLVSQWIR